MSRFLRPGDSRDSQDRDFCRARFQQGIGAAIGGCAGRQHIVDEDDRFAWNRLSMAVAQGKGFGDIAFALLPVALLARRCACAPQQIAHGDRPTADGGSEADKFLSQNGRLVIAPSPQALAMLEGQQERAAGIVVHQRGTGAIQSASRIRALPA